MRIQVNNAALPDASLLQRFVDSGDYTDCYTTHIDIAATFPEYVEAFYTTAVFKAERLVLGLVGYSSTDDEARAVSTGAADRFAAWRVLERADNQLLLMDVRGQTCSWFRLEPEPDGTRLYFGSAVIRGRKTSSGNRMRWTYRSMLGFHRLYSRILLRAAGARLTKE